jgi:hypothetical protein
LGELQVRNFVLALAALALTLALAGCATKGVFLLSDGRIPTDDPVLKEQLEKDLTICNGEAQKANLSGNVVNSFSRNMAVAQVGRGCMAQKGYVLSRKEDVESKQKELQDAAAEKAHLEAAAAARRATTAKPKPEQASKPEQTPAPQSQ